MMKDWRPARHLGLSLTAMALLGAWLTGANGAPPPATAAASVTPLPLISRGVPVYADASASYSRASAANDADYNTTWTAGALPATIAFDLSGVASALRPRIDVVWYNDGNYGYDDSWPGFGHPHTYRNPGAYTLEVNAAPGGGKPPTAGWTTLATVTDNALLSREHVIDFAGMNWVRLRITATAANPAEPGYTASINVDIYGVSGPITDGWLFVGDSIPAGAMRHTNPDGVKADSFGNQVAALAHVSPPIEENAGMPYFTAATMAPLLPGYLKLFPGKFVTLILGSNDAADAGSTAAYTRNMEALVHDVLAAGKVPVIPTAIWSCEPNRVANLPSINRQIRALYAAHHEIVQGPDLFAYFADPEHQAWIRGNDCIHPNGAGMAAYRELWARWAAGAVYAHATP